MIAGRDPGGEDPYRSRMIASRDPGGEDPYRSTMIASRSPGVMTILIRILDVGIPWGDDDRFEISRGDDDPDPDLRRGDPLDKIKNICYSLLRKEII